MASKRPKQSLDRISEMDEISKSQNMPISQFIETEYFGAQIPRSVVLRLKRLALDRKSSRVEPWKIKDMAALALTEWLERNEK